MPPFALVAEVAANRCVRSASVARAILGNVAFSARDFAEDTDFERFALERLGPHRVRPGDVDAIFHDEADPVGGGRRRKQIHTLEPAVSGAQAQEELRASLRPLGFGAAYKLLDMLVEHVLRGNGARSGRLTFEYKSKRLAATRPALLPCPLDERTDVWDRLARVYTTFQDARNAVTHRRAQATAGGDLEVYDDGRTRTATIGSGQCAAFAGAVHTLAEAVIDVDRDPRRMNIVAWHLNTLIVYHRLPVLPAIDPHSGRRLLITDVHPLEDGLVSFDVVRARELIDRQPPALWDLELRSGDLIFAGRWEDIANDDLARIDFHPASPPLWLSSQAA